MSGAGGGAVFTTTGGSSAGGCCGAVAVCAGNGEEGMVAMGDDNLAGRDAAGRN